MIAAPDIIETTRTNELLLKWHDVAVIVFTDGRNQAVGQFKANAILSRNEVEARVATFMEMFAASA